MSKNKPKPPPKPPKPPTNRVVKSNEPKITPKSNGGKK